MPQSKQGLLLGNAGTTTTVRTAVLVAKDGDLVVDWAALSPVSSRDAYSGVAEVSVYVAEKFRGGVGSRETPAESPGLSLRICRGLNLASQHLRGK